MPETLASVYLEQKKYSRAIQAYEILILKYPEKSSFFAQSGASPSTVLRRLTRLRDLGVVTAEVAVVDPKKVGRPLMMIVGVRLQGENAKAASDFMQTMRAHSAVMQCYFVTGEADYIVHLSVADMEEFNAFVQDHQIANPHVQMTATNGVISPLKVGLAVPSAD